MKREFLVNIVFLVFINLLIKPFYIFGIDRTVQNMVGTDEYGLFFAFFNFTYLFQIINDFGIQNYNNRNIAQHNFLLEKYFPNILTLKFLLGIAYLLVVLVIGICTGFVEKAFLLFLLVAMNHFILSIVLFLRSNISGLAFYRTDSALSALDKFLMILICGFLLWGPMKEGFQIEWFVLAQTVSLLITAAIAFGVVRKHLTRFKITINKPLLLVLLKKSYPYALVIFLMTLYTRIDAVMLKGLLVDGKTEAGIYAAAYRLLDASNVFGFLFAGLLLPMFSKMLKDREPIHQMVRFSIRLIWAGAITLAVATFFFRKEIMDWLYTGATAYWGDILGYLILSFIAVSGTYIYGTLLTANESLRKMNILFLIGIAVNVVLNYILIFQFKAAGAAIATLITQSFVMIAQVILTLKECSLNIDFQLIGQIILFALGIIAISYTAYYLVAGQWLIKFAGALGAGITLAFVLRMISPSLLLNLIKPKSILPSNRK